MTLIGIIPGLAVVLVGQRRDSATYVRMKKTACAEVGVESFGIGELLFRQRSLVFHVFDFDMNDTYCISKHYRLSS